MAAAKRLTAQQQRDRRAKIMLGVLGAVLLVVVAIEVPSMMGSKKSSPSAVTTATTATGAAAAAGSTAAPASLASAQVVATPQAGQLRSFSRFAPKDPFHALVSTQNGSGSGSSTSSSSTASSTTGSPTKSAAGSPTAPPAAPTVTFAQSTTTATVPTGPMVLGAVMRLDGVRRLIAVGSEFPATNPVFKLVAVGRKAIWISLIGGSFGNGQQTLKIQRGHPIKLVNTTTSVSYLLRLMRMTMLPKPAAVTTTTPTTTSATTTGTTSTTSTEATTTTGG